MPTRNVVLTGPQAHLIDALVAEGRFQNASEAIRAGLRLLEQDEARSAALRDRLMRGVAQARAGDFATGTGAEAIRRAFAPGDGPR